MALVNFFGHLKSVNGSESPCWLAAQCPQSCSSRVSNAARIANPHPHVVAVAVAVAGFVAPGVIGAISLFAPPYLLKMLFATAVALRGRACQLRPGYEPLNGKTSAEHLRIGRMAACASEEDQNGSKKAEVKIFARIQGVRTKRSMANLIASSSPIPNVLNTVAEHG